MVLCDILEPSSPVHHLQFYASQLGISDLAALLEFRNWWPSRLRREPATPRIESQPYPPFLYGTFSTIVHVRTRLVKRACSKGIKKSAIYRSKVKRTERRRGPPAPGAERYGADEGGLGNIVH